MTNLPPVLYRGSVKNVRGEVSAENILFEFSDRFSVFDWGEMPDHLDGKGKALALMGKAFFQYLGDPVSWQGLFNSDSLKKHFSFDHLSHLENSFLYKKYCTEGLPHHALLFEKDVVWESPLLKVKNIKVERPLFDGKNYNYDLYKKRPLNTLVPLEIIFRLGLAQGNSLSKRLGNDLDQWKKYGFHSVGEIGLLRSPVIDFSTKLEHGDRYIDYSEALEIAGLSEAEFNELSDMTHLVALNLFHFHAQLGLELWDGKIEVAFIEGTGQERSFMLVDSIGIDELRLLYNGESFSKEFLREFYKKGPWFESLELAKKEALQGGGDFKKICISKYQASPTKLDGLTKTRAESVYKSYANEVTKSVSNTIFFDEGFCLKNYKKRFL